MVWKGRTMVRNSLRSIVLIYLRTILLNSQKSLILIVQQSDEQDVEQDSEMFDNRTEDQFWTIG
jgi:hypothetical protein